jgi:hypothetical protein
MVDIGIQNLHTSSIVIDRYSNFGNTYLSKEFARVLGSEQIVTSLEHLAQCRGVSQVTTIYTGIVLTEVKVQSSCKLRTYNIKLK